MDQAHHASDKPILWNWLNSRDVWASEAVSWHDLSYSSHPDLAPGNFVVENGSWFSDAVLGYYYQSQGSLWAAHNQLAHRLCDTRSALYDVEFQLQQVREADYLSDGHWVQFIVGLFRQIQLRNLRVEVGDLFRAAKYDLRAAYHLLATAFQHALNKREGRLQSGFKILAKLAAAFWARLSISFSVRNLITTQRSWFLHHGSHPNDTLRSATGWFSTGCICFNQAN